MTLVADAPPAAAIASWRRSTAGECDPGDDVGRFSSVSRELALIKVATTAKPGRTSLSWSTYSSRAWSISRPGSLMIKITGQRERRSRACWQVLNENEDRVLRYPVPAHGDAPAGTIPAACRGAGDVESQNGA